jgi:hypothetical protein
MKIIASAIAIAVMLLGTLFFGNSGLKDRILNSINKNVKKEVREELVDFKFLTDEEKEKYYGELKNEAEMLFEQNN